MEALIDIFVSIGEAVGAIVEFLEQGFEAINTFLSLPGEAFLILGTLSNFFPAVVWVPLMSIISIVLVLRVWKIVTSGD